MNREISFSIVGSGGEGAVVAGDIVAMACASEGLHVIKSEAYGPQIRGGESSCTVRISSAPIFAQPGALDALVVFSWSDYERFHDELQPGADCAVFYDAADKPGYGAAADLVPVPFMKGSKNIFALGLLASLFGLPLEAIRSAVRLRFSKKSASVIETNLRAFDEGVAFQSNATPRPLTYTRTEPRLLMSGNEASVYGALHAGCTFFAGYPITPSTEILQLLSQWLPKVGASCIQTEDELSAIGAVIGASFAGAKAMTATSGPGLSLMAEMVGLASIAEVPAVIIDVQRGGPSTGIPTKSEQSDLLHAVFASHGDTPRVVLACCDVEDAFHTTVDAFNIAEEYQLPVIVLSDQLIAQRRETIERASFKHDVQHRRLADGKSFQRYVDTEDGVSPMTIPGMDGGMYQTNGLEHDELGRPSSMFSIHEKMNAKRYRKLTSIAKKYRLYQTIGRERPDLGIVCWGSSAGPVREALDALNVGDLRVAAFIPKILAPLPAAELQTFADSCERLLVIDLSYAGQFHQYLRSQIDLPRAKTNVLSRSGGKALAVSEVISTVRHLLGAEMLEETLV
ncbi:MAG TPA: 2-oxoacid:acceptor oxidoreductase subunit alpha [Thermoanaerobaculia bacterium]|nr:2-oxoacid:acceptor oxidoreductase subunit alpha [Thermoanaerobaculia bacterium]